ncbi:Integrase, catalytic core protein, partial [Phytophthora megakarya]
GYKRFQLVQNEASRYLWGFLLYRKKNASDVVLEHLKWVTVQGINIEVLNSDQGKELFNIKLKIFLRSKGIEYTTTNPYSPEENGLVERMNDVVLSRVRCLLTAANMP